MNIVIMILFFWYYVFIVLGNEYLWVMMNILKDGKYVLIIIILNLKMI